MGTVLLSVLSGHWRYAHINGLRGDGINPGLLGMSGTVSEDAVRLAMTRNEETAGLDWLSTQIIPKHYRDRADAENCFDELKNQWGWNGYTSRRLASSRLMANLVALFYNWWNLYLRFYDEEHHREAIRTRPMLMSGVGRQIQSGGRRTVKVSVLHEKGDHIARAVTRISNELHHIRAITERWSVDQRWTLLLTRLLRRWLGGKWLFGLPEDAGLLLSG